MPAFFVDIVSQPFCFSVASSIRRTVESANATPDLVEPTDGTDDLFVHAQSSTASTRHQGETMQSQSSPSKQSRRSGNPPQRCSRLIASLFALLAMGAWVAQAVAQGPVQPTASPDPIIAVTGDPAAVDPGVEGARALDRADLDAWLDGYMPYALGTGDIAGAVVVVVRDGAVLTQRGYGFSDVETRKPVDPETTLFRPGSVSKLVTWTAVMQLVERGQLDLDADVNEYLDFSIPRRNDTPVTLRQIMTHTAGFEEAVKNIMFFDVDKLTTLGDYLKTWVPTRFLDPVTTPAYSNYATALAGYIVERVSGQSFDDYVDEHIFAPLGMDMSTFRQPLPEHLTEFMSRGYKVASADPVEFEIVGPAPAGSLSSPGADMARFMIAHLQEGAFGDGRILEAETARTMHRTAHTVVPPLNRMELGFFETNINGRRVIAHLGDTVAFHTALHLFLEEGVGLYLSVNSLGKAGAAGTLRSALFEDFSDRYLPAEGGDGGLGGQPLVATVDEETAARHAQQMVGVWQVSRRSDSNFFAITNLLGQAKINVGSDNQLVIPMLVGRNGEPREWVEVEPYVWHATNSHERLAAVVEDGSVVRWSVDGFSPFMVFDRVPASKSSAWLLPALAVAVGAMLLTALLWPIAALVRRHFKTPLALEGRERLAYRGVRVAAVLIVAVLTGWLAAIVMMSGNIANLTSSADKWLWLLQILGLFVFVGGLAVMVWNLWLAFSNSRRWTSKLWSVVLAGSALVVLYTAVAYKLLSFTVNY